MNAFEEDMNDQVEEVLEPISEEEQKAREERVSAFRHEVLAWKKEFLNSITENQQDTLVLNKFRNELVQLFYLLRDVLEGFEPAKELEAHPLWQNLKSFFPLHDGIERVDLTHLMYRDLVEYPFTFNQKLINAFLKKNSLEHAEILPNK